VQHIHQAKQGNVHREARINQSLKQFHVAGPSRGEPSAPDQDAYEISVGLANLFEYSILFLKCVMSNKIITTKSLLKSGMNF
jgi:hypothetical protein